MLNSRNIPVLCVKIITLAFLCICSSSNSNAQLFRTFYTSIKVLQSPLSFSLDDPQKISYLAVDTALANHFKPKYSNIVGRIFPDRDFVSIIYLLPSDVGTFIIETRTFDGNPIDTLNISGNWIVDAGIESSYGTVINTDGIITINDTLRSVALDKHDNPIPGTDSTRVQIKKYHLEQSGSFISIHDSTFYIK